MASVDYGILEFFHDYGVHQPVWLTFWHDVSAIFALGITLAVLAFAPVLWRAEVSVP